MELCVVPLYIGRTWEHPSGTSFRVIIIDPNKKKIVLLVSVFSMFYFLLFLSYLVISILFYMLFIFVFCSFIYLIIQPFVLYLVFVFSVFMNSLLPVWWGCLIILQLYGTAYRTSLRNFDSNEKNFVLEMGILYTYL